VSPARVGGFRRARAFGSARQCWVSSGLGLGREDEAPGSFGRGAILGASSKQPLSNDPHQTSRTRCSSGSAAILGGSLWIKAVQ